MLDWIIGALILFIVFRVSAVFVRIGFYLLEEINRYGRRDSQ